MRKLKNSKDSDHFPVDTSSDRGGPIGPANWVARFKSWPVKTVIRNHRASDNGNPTPAPWHAWMTWFSEHGISVAFFESHGVVLVPETWPEDFDSAWYPSDKEWSFPFVPED